jgi:hypothetical protein
MRSLSRTSLLTLATAALMLGLVSCSPFFPAPSPTVPVVPPSMETPVPSLAPTAGKPAAASLTASPFPTHTARAGNDSNQLVVIGKGPKLAILINDSPLSGIDARVPLFGEFVFWSMDAILGIDNLKVWNIANIPLP